MPYEVFPAADGQIVLAVGNDGQFASFCRVAGRPELAEDARFRTNPERVRHRDVLVPIVRTSSCAHEQGVDREAGAASVPCGPINNMQEVFEDPQVHHRGMRVEIPHPGRRPCPTVASPMRFSATPVEYSVPPPLLGEHTREVLGRVLGMSGAEIEALAGGGVI